MDGTGPGSVVTERLGWPPSVKLWRRILLWETQDKLVYDDRYAEPTATCHLQVSPDVPALCGHPWELLVSVPGELAWTDLHPGMRCPDCSDEAGLPEEDPTGRHYRYDWGEGSGHSPQG